MTQTSSPHVVPFFDEHTFTVTYVVHDPATDVCAVVDSVLDFDHASGRTDTSSVDEVIAFIKEKGWTLDWILETHVHADHLSAAPYIQEKLGGKIAIGENIRLVQDTFGKVFNEGTEFQRDGSQFDRLLKEGDQIKLGSFTLNVLYTPGHTPACMTYVVGDAAFVGDTLFMPDFGSARCDFPGGSADQMWDSVQKILSLPDNTRVFVGHDYKAEGRDHYAWESTVGEQKTANKHVGGGKTKEEFVKARTERDAQLAMPRLILPSLQVNMRGGRFPEPEDDGRVYLKTPVNGV